MADLVNELLIHYQTDQAYQQNADAAFEALFGIDDDNVTDMSITVRQTLYTRLQAS